MSGAGKTQKSKFSPEIRRKKKPRNPNPLPPPVEHRFKPGQSGNPGGRPKIVSDAYKEWLAEADEYGVTNALKLARSIGARAIDTGDVQAAKELRQATEGDTMRWQTWQSELIDALKAGQLSTQELIDGIGIDDARPLLIAAGKAVPEGTPPTSGPGLGAGAPAPGVPGGGSGGPDDPGA